MAQERIETISKTIQVLSIMTGIVISVLSFNAARRSEAAKAQLEASKPFLELRQKLYLDAVQRAAILANPEVHSKDELDAAKKRFRELYVAELSMVEGSNVEGAMMQLAAEVDPEVLNLNSKQKAAYDLSHILRNSLVTSWKLDEKIVDNPR